MSLYDPEDFLQILIGVPPEFNIGEITTVMHEVICFAGTNTEIVTTPEDLITVIDEKGRDVSKYAWWAKPGKYVIKVTSFAICPALGAEKAPTSIAYLKSPEPPKDILTYDYDLLIGALGAGKPNLLKAKEQTFTNRSKPHNIGVVSLRLTNLNAPSGIETDPDLFDRHAPTGINFNMAPAIQDAPTGIVSAEQLEQKNSPTNIQEYEGLTNVHSPTNLISYTASSVQPRNATVQNLDFTRSSDYNPGNVGITDLAFKVGPESIVSTASLNSNGAPTGLSASASPSSLSSVTGLGTLVDMDEDGYYVGVDNDDNDHSITIHLQARHAPTSIDTKASPAALTGFSYLIDMDEDGYYSNNDIDDNDPTRFAPPLIPTVIYIYPEVKTSRYTASSTGVGTHLINYYNTYNFSNGATSNTLCQLSYFTSNSCYPVYNAKSYYGPTIPGTYHLGGVYELATSDTSSSPYYIRTQMLNLTDGTYVQDTNASKPTLSLVNNYATGWSSRWKLSWDYRPEMKFNFGGLINHTEITNDSWIMSNNGSTGIANLGNTDLSSLVNATFHIHTGQIDYEHAYRLAYAYKI